MPTLQWPDVGQMLVSNDHAAGAQLGDDALHLQGVPQHHRVRQQPEAAGFVHDRFVVAGAEFALIGEEQPAGQAVPGLTTVELGLDARAERRVVQVAQDVAGFDQTAERGQGLGDTVVGTAGGETLQHDMGRCRAGLERGGDADELVPLLADHAGVAGPGEQAGDGVRHRPDTEAPQPLIGQVLEARHEVDAE